MERTTALVSEQQRQIIEPIQPKILAVHASFVAQTHSQSHDAYLISLKITQY